MKINQIFHNTFSKRSFFEMPCGSRPWSVLLVIAKGSFRFKLMNDNVEYVVEENEIAYFPPNVYFEREVLSPITFHQFAFNTDTSHPYYQRLTPGKLNIPPEHVEKMIESFETISMLPNNAELLSHSIEHIIIENYIHCQAQEHKPGYADDIAFVIKYMSEHLDEKIDIDELAKMVHLSHVGLLWKFKQYTNTTLSRYLIVIRMVYAKQLVLEGNLRVNEIATKCGYKNPYYFSNAFRNYFGYSPSEFRKKFPYDGTLPEYSANIMSDSDILDLNAFTIESISEDDE